MNEVLHLPAKTEEEEEEAGTIVSTSPHPVVTTTILNLHSSNLMSLISISFSTKAAFEEYGHIGCYRNSSVTEAEEA
ncbi:hypothetical protein E2C01_015856 [Portunus trituberculatus]|uniref:Uncharacterized protein n=1 Tax=Portunus trituberculatus TaxID=210409 RepID=A0A5B7DP28_PORTR|nr:hypothetical protein [Portunus trituberculatus]